MIGAVIEVGPELRTVLMGVVALAGSWVGTRSVRKQMNPNSGSSMRDAVNRIEEGVAGLYDRVDQLDQRVLDVETNIADSLTSDEPNHPVIPGFPHTGPGSSTP